MLILRLFSLIKIRDATGPLIKDGTKPVVVAVFDTGVWEEHPNLSNSVLRDLSKWIKLGNNSFQFFTINTKLPIMVMLASKVFTAPNIKLPPEDQESNAYTTELEWHVLVSLRLLDPFIFYSYAVLILG